MDKEEFVSEDLYVNPGTPRLSLSNEHKLRTRSDNPYHKFIKGFHRAASQDATKVTLAKRSTNITSKIIQDFIGWYKTLGGGGVTNETAAITTEKLHELFQIGFDDPPLKIANRPSKPTLDELLKLDFGEEKRLKEKKLTVQQKPPAVLAAEKLSEDLESMSTVWKGIEQLRSTVAFSNWLQNHYELTPPQYLKIVGLLDIDYPKVLSTNKEFTGKLEDSLILPFPLPTSSKTAQTGKRRIARPCRLSSTFQF